MHCVQTKSRNLTVEEKKHNSLCMLGLLEQHI